MVRGGFRGMRGGPRGVIRGGPRGGMRGIVKPFIPHVPFDLVLVEPAFPPIKNSPNPLDETIQAALIKRNEDLTPTQAEQTAITNLVNRVQAVLDGLIVAPGPFDACQIDEVRQVGDYKKGTMTSGFNTAEMVIVLKTMPTKEAVDALSRRVLELLQQKDPSESVTMKLTEPGFDIDGVSAVVSIRVTTIVQNLWKVDPNLHLDSKLLQRGHCEIRRGRWFEEHAHHSTIKILVRLLRDLKRRFSGFSPLTSWMLDLMANTCIANSLTRQTLSLACAYRRFLQLLAAGFFLPGCAGISDPCEGSVVRVHTNMTLEEQDIVCMTAQTLVRILSHGGYKEVCGLVPTTDLVTATTTWGDISINPHVKVYEKPEKSESMEVENEDQQAPEESVDQPAEEGK